MLTRSRARSAWWPGRARTCGRPSSLGRISTSRIAAGNAPSASPWPMASFAASGRPALGAAAAVVDLASLRNLWRKRSPNRFWASRDARIAPHPRRTRGYDAYSTGRSLPVSGLVERCSALGRDEIGEELQRDDMGWAIGTRTPPAPRYGRARVGERRSPSLIRQHRRVPAILLDCSPIFSRVAAWVAIAKTGNSLSEQGDRPA